MALGALSPNGLVGEFPLINLFGRGCSVGGRDSTNKFIGPWVLSHQMGWWERLHYYINEVLGALSPGVLVRETLN